MKNGTNIMQIKSNISDNVYSIHLEFAENDTGAGEEIRDTLKEKYLQKVWKSLSLKTKSGALHPPAQKGEEEEKNA